MTILCLGAALLLLAAWSEERAAHKRTRAELALYRDMLNTAYPDLELDLNNEWYVRS